MARLSRLNTPNLSSPALRSALQRRSEEAGGVLLWLIALALSCALWSYDPLDPSPDVSTTRVASNLLGWPGSYLSDSLVQGVGLGSSMLVIGLVAWGWRLLRHRGLSVFPVRAAALLCLPCVVGALLAAGPILITVIHAPEWPSDAGVGGGIGATIASNAIAAGTSAIGPAGGVLMWILGGLLALLLAALAFGLDRREWSALGRFTGRSTLWLTSRPVILARRYVAMQRRQELPAGQGTAYAHAGGATPSYTGRPMPETNWTPPSDARRAAVRRNEATASSPRPEPAVAAANAKTAQINDEPLRLAAPQPGSITAPSPAAYPAARGSGRLVGVKGEEDAPAIALPGPTTAEPRPQPIHHVTEPAPHAAPEPEAFEDEQPYSPPAPQPPPQDYARREPPQTEQPAPVAPQEAPRRPLLTRLFGGRDAETGHGDKARARDAANQPGAGWTLPPVSLLRSPPLSRADSAPSREALDANARLLENVLSDFGVQGRIVDIHPGPVVTLYELEPAPGIRAARVIGLADDVARSLSVLSVRIATVPGRNVIGIEVPNALRETVYLTELFDRPEWKSPTGRLELALGKDIAGAAVFSDLAKMPHLLVAGTTGSGKSVGINSMILSLLFRLSPDECRLIMIDPKVLELSIYDGIPHLLTPVVTEPNKAVTALKWVVREMDRRYRAMAHLQVRNIAGYNERAAQVRDRGEEVTRRVQTGYDPETGNPIFEEQSLTLDPLPFIVVIIDEMADLMMTAGKEIDSAVQRLAQKARAAGIHVIMATQRPSVDVITGTIKANFPTRISFQVISKFDSRTILGEQGAEQLLGQGDMLFMQGGGRITRVHGPFVADSEVEAVVSFLREQGEPIYNEDVISEREEETGAAAFEGGGGGGDGDGGLYDKAVAIVIREGKASTSFVQRHLSIGYNRAAKLIEQMEKNNIVSAADHVGRRKVLIGRGADD
ncbi:DNA translocase FtsK 4TM domain-containing protein [Acetobacter sacchari]|uniref:DNA translocase FtsK n=1 Tax=Acetobacter sacchari TaxID=2661687 RepID=A0ABS3LV54_9PROT|nr:DNA translocase FtsK [Acetobacter sacchari]MBO1359774.1 DNA translocase FtsK 4TM domain-containing protein [Acetobacter sacchari]